MECQADQLLVFMDFEVCLVDLAMADGFRWWLICHGANGEGAVAGMIVYLGFPFCFSDVSNCTVLTVSALPFRSH